MIKIPGKMLFELIGSLFKKPATVMYPYDKSGEIEKFRGQVDFDQAKCIGCKICMKDCPSNAITINTVGEKKYEAAFDLAKCIYCAQCVDSCPKKALAISGNFELAQFDKNKLKVTFGEKPQSTTPTKP